MSTHDTPTPAPAVTGDVREALATARNMIRGQMIEKAVVDVETMVSLGEYIDAALSQQAPATDVTHEQIAKMLKRNGFTSRDGTVINGGTYGVIDAILSLTRPHRQTP